MKKTTWDDFDSLEASASEINAVSNVIDSKLAEIHQLVRKAANGISNDVTFIRIGDSTRSLKLSEWYIYDPMILNQININYYNNADPSQTSYDWLNNVDQNTFAQFIANCNGIDGENTIVEFSMGINDWSKYAGDKAQTKQIIVDCINAILTAKPKCKLFLSSPHYHTNDGRRTTLDEVYKEISSEMNLYLVDGLSIPMGPSYDFNNTDYYSDTTHLNQFGMLVLSFYIFNKIMPLDVLKCIDFNEYERPQLEGNAALGVSISIGLLNSGATYNDITFSTNTNYRYIQIPIPIASVIFYMKFKSQGNSPQIFLKYEDDTIQRITPYSADASGYRAFYCPAGVKAIYLNLSTTGSTYDLLNDVPELLYSENARPFIQYSELTQSFKSNINHTRFREGKLIDDYGFVGKIGQTLTIDSSSKMKWA